VSVREQGQSAGSQWDLQMRAEYKANGPVADPRTTLVSGVAGDPGSCCRVASLWVIPSVVRLAGKEARKRLREARLVSLCGLTEVEPTQSRIHSTPHYEGAGSVWPAQANLARQPPLSASTSSDSVPCAWAPTVEPGHHAASSRLRGGGLRHFSASFRAQLSPMPGLAHTHI
jgi:hypothetical protein